MLITKPIFIALLALILISFSQFSIAETMAPDPSLSYEDAWNKLFNGRDNFSTTRLVISAVFGAVLFFFVAWVAMGLYVSRFKPNPSIENQDFIIYILRLLMILLVGVWLWNTGA